MTSHMKPWESADLQNSSEVMRNGSGMIASHPATGRAVPLLPPRPTNSYVQPGYNPYMPYSGFGGSYGSYNSLGMSYRSPYMSSYGTSYGGYGSFGMTNYPSYCPDDVERRFIQFAEERSRSTFASVENIVRAFSSLAMMLDNTFFAMTSSFRAVLSVAENFGRLRNVFGHIWYSINIFRIFAWIYRKFFEIMGYKLPTSVSSMAWKEAAHERVSACSSSPSNWPTLAFLGIIVSVPYIISKFLPDYQDRSNPSNWNSPGVRAKVAFDFVATSPNELTIHTNDNIILAPSSVQEEMNLKNSGWVFAVLNGKSGVVPLNYLVLNKSAYPRNDVPVSRTPSDNSLKTQTKRVSFGENQIIENVDFAEFESSRSSVPTSDSALKNCSNDNISEY